MGKLESIEVPNMYYNLKAAPAIIFDLRNYPNGTLWNLGSLFFPEPIISGKFQTPALTDVYNQNYLPGWYYLSNDGSNLGNWSNPNYYNGKVYILVNQETQSQAEYTCQYLSYHPNAKVIGNQTAGADGNVSYLTLPGGILTYFTSLGCYYADGYQQQRNGVKIDTIVSPTIEGLRKGIDEILQAALNCSTGLKQVENKNISTNIYPNPTTN